MKNVNSHIVKIFLVLVSLVTLFHLGIIAKIIPYNIAWGGQLTNDSEMYVFETISILVNLFISWVLLMVGNLVQFKFSTRTIKIILWVFFALFVLNTIGNFLATTNFEKYFCFTYRIICCTLMENY
jgi:membrane protease YdiL (CAAX protease family)